MINQQEKRVLHTFLEDKYTSQINRLTPYYYIKTAALDFEVDKNTYSFIEIGKSYKIVYTPHSCTILTIQASNQ